jgi:putative SOS response-associated peptidase YedK
MCNAYALNIPPESLADAFLQKVIAWYWPDPMPNFAPMDEVRPTDLAPVVTATSDGGAGLERLKWGLLPSQPKRPPVINFRSEGRAFHSGRCLVPASSFFEFTGTKYPKTRWRFSRTDGDWFCFAGFIGGAGEDRRFTLLTTSPGPDIAPIHDRQPVVVERDGWAGWLRGAPAEGLLAPSAAGTWRYEEAPREKVGTLL